MRKEALQFLSLVISSLLLLYLLFSNLYNEAFILQDWVVVLVDLVSKLIIEMIILSKKE